MDREKVVRGGVSVLVRVGLLLLVVGAVILLSPLFTSTSGGQGAVTCGGKAMSPGDTCFRGLSKEGTYDEMAARARTSGSPVAFGVIAVVAGVGMVAAAVAVDRRSSSSGP